MARHWRVAFLGASFVSLVTAAWFLWRTNRSLHDAAVEIRTGREIRFSARGLDRVLPAGLERIASAASFRDAAVFQDRLWGLSRESLIEYSAEGAPVAHYHTGTDLPAAPLAALAVQEPELFIATEGDGFVIFDGRSFRHIRPEQPALRRITAMLALASGQLLLGTQKAGVLAWDGKALSRFHELLNDVPVTTLAGRLDDLWIGTLDRGVLHLRAGQLTQYGDRLPDPHILSLSYYGDSAFAGTALGVAEFRSGSFHRTLAEGVFAHRLLASAGVLLIGTLEEGILEIPLEAHRPRPRQLAGETQSGRVEQLVRAGEETIAVLPDGLYARERGAAWKRITSSEHGLLADHNIAALAAEPSGRLWIGYFDRGLDMLPPGATRAVHIEDDHVFCVNRIVPTPDGAVIATANGLVLADRAGTPRQVLGRNEGLIASHVTDVLARPDGIIAATPAGITFLSGGAPQSLYAFHGLVNNHVYALAQNGSRLLAGTLGGVSVLDNGAVKASYTTANSGLRHNWVSALVSAGNEFFAGTYGAGIFRFDGDVWRSFPDLATPFEVNPNAMVATDTAVYAGTLGHGLAVYNRATGRWSFFLAGLPSTNVTALAAAHGVLYVGTDNGLVRLPERSLISP
ncbi:MAG: hypothetical protein HY235_18515 [Acidobacteria bacterium]|nr:hypothetical protein [Acidobacteriota bacterium]